MKTISLLSAITASIILMSGCSAPTPKQEAQSLKEEQIKTAASLPSWVLNPQSQDGITAVGMAAYSRHGLRIMRPQAEMDARAKLAGQIQTIVSRSQKQAIRSVQIANVDDMENIFTQSTNEVIKEIPLSGAVVVNQAMVANGDYYVQMVIKKRELINELEAKQDIYKHNLKSAKLTRQSIDDGVKVLDKMMEDLEKDVQK
ncbi:MAG: LPP20 family lipoprotein [Campylobacterota bacterium]|nr:LPP20 family lipoprotein [Campylobacterota bacterium]